MQFNDQWDWSLYLFLHAEKEPTDFENATLNCTLFKILFQGEMDMDDSNESFSGLIPKLTYMKYIIIIINKISVCITDNYNMLCSYLLHNKSKCLQNEKKKTKKLLRCTWQFMFKSEIYLTDTSLLSVLIMTVHFLIV